MATQSKAKKKVVEKSSAASKAKEKKLYVVTFFHKWCKACGLCNALCTKKIIKKDKLGLPYIDKMDSCIGCRFCEIHCPDFAITIKDKHPERRRNDSDE